MPTITVRRGDNWQDMMRKFKVLIDGEVVGKIGRKKSIDTEVSTGPHEVTLKLDWVESQPLTVDTSSGDVSVFCDPSDAEDRATGALAGGDNYFIVREE